MTHILNPKNSQPLDKNLNLAMPTFGPTTREYYTYAAPRLLTNSALSCPFTNLPAAETRPAKAL